MATKTLKSFAGVCLLSAHLFTFSSAFARGGSMDGGGGDASEIRVNEIRSDILNWINDGGAKGLSLPSEISYGEYIDKMSDVLQAKKVAIEFTENEVKVIGASKTCRGFISGNDSKPHILCNISRFKNTADADQYKLIHHEFAGLVNLENNVGAASDYALSTQITDYLEVQTVLKLSVKKSKNNSILTSANDFRMNVEDSLPKYQEWAKSVVFITAKQELVVKDNSFSIDGVNLENYQKVCHTERFSQQLSLPGGCTGVLVGKNKILTSDSCMWTSEHCKEAAFIFDYTDSNVIDGGNRKLSFLSKKENVYFCKKIISHSSSDLTYNNYTVVELDRDVVGRKPLPINKEKGRLGAPLVLFSNPSNLPLKVVADHPNDYDNVEIQNENWKYFKLGIDAFNLSPGAPAINAKTGELEGIVTRFSQDRYMWNGSCNVIRTIPNQGQDYGHKLTYLRNIKLD